MWFFVFLICFGESLLCNAQQEAALDSKIASDVDQVNQGVNWDNARQPITLSIRDGRSSAAYRPQDETRGEDNSLFYSNEWQPFIMPINFNRYGDRSSQQTENEYPTDFRFLPTLLRRPESEANSSAAAERDTFPSTQLPISPFVLYPNLFNLYPHGNSEGNIISVLQNSSASAPQILLSDSTTSNTEEKPNETLPPEHIPITSDVPEPFYPLDFYRQLQEFTSPRARVYIPPYPVLPLARDDSLRPIISPNFNRESGSEVIEGISPMADVAEAGRPTNSEDIQEETIPSEISPNSLVSPPLPLPFPVGAYPFGVVPPAPFVAPLMPNTFSSGGQPFRSSVPINREQPLIANILPRSIPFNPTPYLRFTNVRTENLPDDSIPPVLPPIVANSPLEPTDSIEPALDLPINVGVDGDNSFPDTGPNVAKIPYEFGFDMNDGLGTDQHRKEVSDGSGLVTGSYGYRDLFGVYRLVNYIADKDGFRAIIKSNEPGVASSRSANVVVMAEPPPPHAIAEGITAAEPEVVIAAADETPELTAAVSETVSK